MIISPIQEIFQRLFSCSPKIKPKGQFGGVDNRFLGKYETLRVLKRSERTKENCNAHGVVNINTFKVKEKEDDKDIKKN